MGLFSFLGKRRELDHSLKQASLGAKGSGDVSGHIFENLETGLPRNLYWSVCVDLHAIEYLDDVWETSLTFEWLTMSTKSSSFEISNESFCGPTCTWYFINQHIPAKSGTISLVSVDGFRCVEIAFSALFDFPGFDNDPCQNIEIKGTVKLHCSGVSLLRDHVLPKANSESEARAMIAPYFSEIVSFSHKVQEDEDGWPVEVTDRFLFVP